ncbi:MAG: NAD(P)/FAD-dependent oxidoreductase [Chloroflexota bacterium]
MLDAIVIGARCGGAPTAMLLARRGYRVLLVDRTRFPSESPNGHFIHMGGPRQLHSWGLLDQVIAGGCPAVTSFTMDHDDFPLTGRGLEEDGVAFGYAPRRGPLDMILVDAAADAGAEIREDFGVDGFLWDGPRIVGIRGHDARTGRTVTDYARIIVGADGRNSLLARTAEARAYDEAPTQTCWYSSFWADMPFNGLEAYVRGNRIVLAFPTHDRLTAVAVGAPIGDLRRFQANLEAEFQAGLNLVPDLAARVAAGRRAERFIGMADLPNFYRKPFGPGWALVGDAGFHKDPFLGLGINDAFHSAELLANAIHLGFSGQRELTCALAEYERIRNESSYALYHENLDLAQFKPLPPEIVQLRRAIRGDQHETNQFFLAREGLIPPESFFNPENFARLGVVVPPPLVGAST